jgi:hypothetical protein
MPADAARVRSAGIPQPASSVQEGSRCQVRGDWPDGESLRERADGRTHLPLGSISPSSSLHHSSLSRGNRLTVATRRGGEEGRGEPFRARLWGRRDSASKRRKTKKHKAAADGCNYPGLSYAYFIFTFLLYGASASQPVNQTASGSLRMCTAWRGWGAGRTASPGSFDPDAPPGHQCRPARSRRQNSGKRCQHII